MKWTGESSAQEPGFGGELLPGSSTNTQQGRGFWPGEGRNWELQFGWLSCTVGYRGLCVMPAGLIVLCRLPCGWIPSSSYLKNTWAAHNFRLWHSSEAVVTTWLFKAMSCLPCLAELGYSLHSYIPNSWAASKRFFPWPGLLPGILQLSDLNVEPWLCLKLGNFWPAASGRMLAMFGIEDCVMGGLNQHLSCLIHCWTFHLQSTSAIQNGY